MGDMLVGHSRRTVTTLSHMQAWRQQRGLKVADAVATSVIPEAAPTGKGRKGGSRKRKGSQKAVGKGALGATEPAKADDNGAVRQKSGSQKRGKRGAKADSAPEVAPAADKGAGRRKQGRQKGSGKGRPQPESKDPPDVIPAVGAGTYGGHFRETHGDTVVEWESTAPIWNLLGHALGHIEGTQGGKRNVCSNMDKVPNIPKTCADAQNEKAAGCLLYRNCQKKKNQNGNACYLAGYMALPVAAFIGNEMVNPTTAKSVDHVWTAAEAACQDKLKCVIMANPMAFRSQHHLHLHYRPFNDRGLALKSKLEESLCGTTDWQWFDVFGFCANGGLPVVGSGSANARIYDKMPGVFSEVIALANKDWHLSHLRGVCRNQQGQPTLGSMAVTVFFTTKCGGGTKIMVLASNGCSVEHEIFTHLEKKRPGSRKAKK